MIDFLRRLFRGVGNQPLAGTAMQPVRYDSIGNSHEEQVTTLVIKPERTEGS